MSLPDLNRRPGPCTDVATAFYRAPGQPVQRCTVRCMTKAGLFIEGDAKLPVGLEVELALVRSNSSDVVSVDRRYARVSRAAESGAAILLFLRRKRPRLQKRPA